MLTMPHAEKLLYAVVEIGMLFFLILVAILGVVAIGVAFDDVLPDDERQREWVLAHGHEDSSREGEA